VEPILLKADTDGVRLDVFLAEKLGDLSRSAAVRLIENGCVRLGGEPARKNRRIAAGEIYEVRLPEPAETSMRAQDIPLDIVYEDADVLVVNKPRGMVVHPAPGHPRGRSSTRCSPIAVTAFRGSAEKSVRVLSTGSTRIRPASSLPPKNDLSHRALSAS
jgi:23S rRNA pseudouridine1911/1915/1917 synthase